VSPAAASIPVRTSNFTGKAFPQPVITPPAVSSLIYPDATNTPAMLSGSVMAYYPGAPADLTQHQVTLQALPASGSSFGVDKTTLLPNSGAYYNPGGWIDLLTSNTLVTGYNFDALEIGSVQASGCVVQQCWFHNTNGQDNWAVWVHDYVGGLNGFTIQDCLINGTSTSVTGPDGILKQDNSSLTNAVIRRCHTFNFCSAFQFAPINGTGIQPYGNVVYFNYFEACSDPSGFGVHLEDMNVSAGTGGLLVQQNHMTGPNGQTATIYISHDFGDVGNIIMTNNLLDGLPQNTIYAGDTGEPNGVLIAAAGNTQITGNKFANTGGQNPGGYVIDPVPGDSRLLVTGNVYWPSLLPVPGM